MNTTFDTNTKSLSSILRRALLLAVGIASLTAASTGFANEMQDNPNAAGGAQTQQEYHRLILIKFADGATAADIDSVKQKFCALGRSYAGLEEAVWIEDSSLCQKSAYTHAVTLRFSCPVAAASYREHPQCKAMATEDAEIVASQLEMAYEITAGNISRPRA